MSDTTGVVALPTLASLTVTAIVLAELEIEYCEISGPMVTLIVPPLRGTCTPEDICTVAVTSRFPAGMVTLLPPPCRRRLN